MLNQTDHGSASNVQNSLDISVNAMGLVPYLRNYYPSRRKSTSSQVSLEQCLRFCIESIESSCTLKTARRFCAGVTELFYTLSYPSQFRTKSTKPQKVVQNLQRMCMKAAKPIESWQNYQWHRIMLTKTFHHLFGSSWFSGTSTNPRNMFQCLFGLCMWSTKCL